MHRWQDRSDTLTRSPANRVRRRRKRQEHRRVWLLQRFWHHADRGQHAILDALAVLHRRLEIPGRCAGRYLPVLALERQHLLGPAFLDDLPVLLERLAVGLIDRIMMMRQGPRDAMRLLRHDVDPAPLVTAGETSAGPPAGHVIEHRDIL